MKIEKIMELDQRKIDEPNRYGNKYIMVGIKLIPQNKADKDFLKKFDTLFEDTNGHIEHDAFDDIFTISTVKGW